MSVEPIHIIIGVVDGDPIWTTSRPSINLFIDVYNTGLVFVSSIPADKEAPNAYYADAEEWGKVYTNRHMPFQPIQEETA